MSCDSSTSGGADPMAFSSDNHRALIADFLDAVQEKRPPMIPGNEALAVHRLWATCDTRNTGSYAIMDKLGMRREGTIRQNQPSRDGGWRDTYLYAVLASEWRARAA